MNNLQRKIDYLEINIMNANHGPKTINDYGFTVKELEVIENLCRKKQSNQQLSEELFVSLGTVKQHLSRIYAKCGAKNRVKVINLFKDNFL